MIHAILAGLPALEAPLTAALPNGGWGEVVYHSKGGRERSPCRLFLNRYAKHHSLNSMMFLAVPDLFGNPCRGSVVVLLRRRVADRRSSRGNLVRAQSVSVPPFPPGHFSTRRAEEFRSSSLGETPLRRILVRVFDGMRGRADRHRSFP